MKGQPMTTTTSVKLGVLRRFARIVSAAFVAGGVPGAVAAVQSPRSMSSGRSSSARRAWRWPPGRWPPWTRPCAVRYGSWLGLVKAS